VLEKIVEEAIYDKDYAAGFLPAVFLCKKSFFVLID
jgi:hypothetical protein